MKYKFILLFIIFLFSVSLYPYELRLNYSKSYIDNGVLYADVNTSYSESIYENIKRYVDNGIIVFINFRLDLVKKRLFFYDNTREIYLYRKIYYDFFTKEYVVLSSETMRETRDSDLKALIKNVSEINRIEVSNVNNLNKDGVYLFKTRLSIRFQNAYPYLSVFFNIITPIRYRIKWKRSDEFTLKDLY